MIDNSSQDKTMIDKLSHFKTRHDNERPRKDNNRQIRDSERMAIIHAARQVDLRHDMTMTMQGNNRQSETSKRKQDKTRQDTTKQNKTTKYKTNKKKKKMRSWLRLGSYGRANFYCGGDSSISALVSSSKLETIL